MSQAEVGLVIIGRNEGERLRRCFRSIIGDTKAAVYVDSGSTDESVEFARSLGIDVVELDVSSTFTAARARNAGFRRLCSRFPSVAFVQFLDGDCELRSGWLQAAAATLTRHGEAGVVCGHLRERRPGASVYNRLCDMEWQGPVGEIAAAPGIAMIRRAAMQQVGGYDDSVIAAEDDELCVRLRLCGWKILRIDAEMALHDANMSHFSQWWRRASRCGHAYAQVSSLHGRTPLRHFVGENRSTFFWGGLLPVAVVVIGIATGGWGFLLFGAYGLQAARIYRRLRQRGTGSRDALLYALSCVGAKFPEHLGQLRYWINRLRRRPSTIMEYKGVT